MDTMSDKAATKMLNKRGCELAKDGVHSEAFLRFSKAYALDSNPIFLANKILSVFKVKSSGESCEEIEGFLSRALQYVDDIFNDISKLILPNAIKAEFLSQCIFFLPSKAYILNVLEYYQKTFELTHGLDYLVKKIIFCLDTAISQYSYQKIQVHFNEALKYTLDLVDE